MVLSVASQRALAALRCRTSGASPLATALRTLSCGRVARTAAPIAVSSSASHSIAPGTAPLEVGASHAASGAARLAARQRQADCLTRWNWLDSPERRLAAAVPFGSLADCPPWLSEEYEAARSYRSARARLWLPSSSAAADASPAEQTAYVDRLKDTFRRVAERHPAMDGVAFDDHDAWRAPGLQQTLDEELVPYWRELSEAQRQASSLRLRFECIRRLGWRAGYTAGYPLANSSAAIREARKVLVSKTGTAEKNAAAREDARQQLVRGDEAAAWTAWQRLSAEARVEEERAAWSQRDRSRLWIDDSSTSLVLGESAPRWFANAPRVGIPTLLPTEVVRLVRNFVPKGGKPDPWKASFRLPLDMSKHALVNYLRSIYGLHTTWVRTQVYRSRISRSRVGRGKTAKGERTWKKAEVGLLEPFVFPESTQLFRRENLMSEEMRHEVARFIMKATGHKRWRSVRPADPLRVDIDAAEARAKAERLAGGTSAEALSGQVPRDAAGARPALLVRSGGIQTKRHSRILKLLNEQRKDREALIEKKAQELSKQA